jgi:hypothetical protein
MFGNRYNNQPSTVTLDPKAHNEAQSPEMQFNCCLMDMK